MSDNPIAASYLYLLEPEIRFLEAAVEHLIPTDELSPGARDAGVVVDAAISRFTPEDQLILRLRFSNTRKVSEIARTLSIDQKKVYKRIEKMLSSMRRALERAGISRSEIGDLLARGDHDVLIAKFEAGKNETGHTHLADGGFETKGRLPR